MDLEVTLDSLIYILADGEVEIYLDSFDGRESGVGEACFVEIGCDFLFERLEDATIGTLYLLRIDLHIGLKLLGYRYCRADRKA